MILEILKAAISSAATPDEAVKNIQKSLGGAEIYIPSSRLEERNLQIRLSYNGRNHAEVCKKHCISLRTLYRIID